MHKTSGIFQTVVAFHNFRDRAKEAVEALQDRSLPERIKEKWNNTRREVSTKSRNFFSHPEDVPCEHIPQIYSYIFRPKSTWEMVLLGGTVCGIEFCYAAETAFVTPILLSLGLNIKFVTMIWCLSPLIGFFLTPILGSLSDSCESSYGRRRPFILLLSVGIILGLIFVPNGHHIGIALGDTPNLKAPLPETLNDSQFNKNDNTMRSVRTVDNLLYSKRSLVSENFTNQSSNLQNIFIHPSAYVFSTWKDPHLIHLNRSKRFAGKGNTQASRGFSKKNVTGKHVQPWSITFTVLGTVLLDFCSDACQSPSRTYLLDVSLPEDHTAGLSTFTLMAGLGGSIGYLMGAVHWEETFFGNMLGGQVNVVFTIVAIVFVICLICTLRSFPEIPLPLLKDPKVFDEYQKKLLLGEYQEKGNELKIIESTGTSYGTAPTGVIGEVENPTPNGILNGISYESEVTKDDEDANCGELTIPVPQPAFPPPSPALLESDQPTLKEYLRSIVKMPRSLRVLCLTNLFCWMSLVCYSLYFTDFVGEVVYGGDPQAPEGSESEKLFKDGVSFGCWGMALYSISCSIYSYFIESLVKRLGAKPVYIGGQLVYSVGMIIMAAARHPAAVILLSPTAGVMYSTLFTMPYLLIAHYHCMQQFRDDKSGGDIGVRGIGTDVATVSSMVFLSQFILSLTMGSIVEAVGSNTATVCAAAILSACGAASATQVMYLDM